MALPEQVLDAAVKSTLVLAAAGSAAWLLRHRSAAARHGVWALALAGLVALPILSLTLPGWSLPLPAGHAAVAEAPAEDFLAADTVAELRSSPPSVAVYAAAAPTTPPSAGSRSPAAADDAPLSPSASPATPGDALSFWFAFGWSAGATVTVLPLLAALVSLWSLRRNCRRVTGGPLSELLANLSVELGVRRPVALLHSTANSRPPGRQPSTSATPFRPWKLRKRLRARSHTPPLFARQARMPLRRR